MENFNCTTANLIWHCIVCILKLMICNYCTCVLGLKKSLTRERERCWTLCLHFHDVHWTWCVPGMELYASARTHNVFLLPQIVMQLDIWPIYKNGLVLSSRLTFLLWRLSACVWYGVSIYFFCPGFQVRGVWLLLLLVRLKRSLLLLGSRQPLWWTFCYKSKMLLRSCIHWNLSYLTYIT